MAREPFHESALARYDEAQEASQKLLASLDELRQKADNFLTVAASTSTMLAALASAGPLQPPSPAETDPSGPRGPAVDQPLVDQTPEPVQTEPVRTEPVQTDPSPPEGFRRLSTERHACAVESTIAPAITSPNNVKVTVGTRFIFTVTTVGAPVPWITEQGERPKHFTFIDNCDGTATLSGTPRKTGVYFTSFRAKFGQGTLKYRVIQSFTLNVVADV